MYWTIWIIQSPTSSLFPVPSFVPERDLSCSKSPSYRSVSSFIQFYLYRLLAATSVKEFLLMSTIRGLTPRPKSLTGFSVCHHSVVIPFRHFFVGCDQKQSFSTPTVASILWLRIKTPPRPFWGKHDRLVAALGWLWAPIGVAPSSVSHVALRLPIPLKYPLQWNLGASLWWKLTRDVLNSVSLIGDTFYFLGGEIGNKTRQKGIDPETNLERL